jgi:uncharacterized protein
MILEGLVTTTNPDGSPHLAPMGPHVEPDMRRFLLRPFPTSNTYQNLSRHHEGVLHVSDDVLLLAKAAVRAVEMPAVRPAREVRGWVIADACRSHEFRVRSIDASEQRVRIECEVVRSESLRDFFGFNRGKHAVLEAAILATRLHLLPQAEVEAEYRKLRVIVDKTGGPVELEAMAFLEAHLTRYPVGGPSA